MRKLFLRLDTYQYTFNIVNITWQVKKIMHLLQLLFRLNIHQRFISHVKFSFNLALSNRMPI